MKVYYVILSSLLLVSCTTTKKRVGKNYILENPTEVKSLKNQKYKQKYKNFMLILYSFDKYTNDYGVPIHMRLMSNDLEPRKIDVKIDVELFLDSISDRKLFYKLFEVPLNKFYYIKVSDFFKSDTGYKYKDQRVSPLLLKGYTYNVRVYSEEFDFFFENIPLNIHSSEVNPAREILPDSYLKSK